MSEKLVGFIGASVEFKERLSGDRNEEAAEMPYYPCTAENEGELSVNAFKNGVIAGLVCIVDCEGLSL